MATKVTIKNLEGTRDFYPDKMRWRNWLFNLCREVSERYGYEEFDGPFLESFELFAAKSGEELVNEQTYTFETKGGDKVAIRPEMTPTLARMVAAKQNELRKPIRWYTIPNIWRHERAQRGRKREFYQYNVDILGVDSIDADAEIMAVVIDIMRAVGLDKQDIKVRVSNRYYLEELLNSLGVDLSLKEQVYRWIDRIEKIKPEAFRANLLEVGLNEQQVEGLEARLRSRDFSGFKPLEEFWEKAKQYGYAELLEFDPSIVRGLLYYTGTVFEVWDATKRFTRAIMGGGRYDNLVNAVGGQPLAGVGIAFSDVVMEEMLTQVGKMPELPRQLDVYVAQYSAAERPESIKVATILREAGLKTELNLLNHDLGKQLKAASACGARFAVILAPEELARGEVNVKNLLTREQFSVPLGKLIATIKA
ncbi:MAG: histidine--tRNA ligase [Chloroflexi bacterium]|uniref:Histidine--tRNA ligase n=1 Tax=Candidatus Chlorohelix allophototropha TaxID=3003348 RepID=A0A8T7M506_9CHLR|nr:histidine--tRNA ligase [Chloroflexota bacterium]WJW69102.1 histidine--tRNA ligase [Chloroflexota bacterium L227-S17]